MSEFLRPDETPTAPARNPDNIGVGESQIYYKREVNMTMERTPKTPVGWSPVQHSGFPYGGKPVGWSPVQHSGFPYGGKPGFEWGLEPAAVNTSAQSLRVEAAGGKVFPDYEACDAFCFSEEYPEGHEGIYPLCSGRFAPFRLDGRRIYIAQTPEEATDADA